MPFKGSLPFLTDYPELTLHKWAKKFGSLYSMWLGDQLFVVVSDPQIVKDLVITNGAIFSSRKEMFMKSKIIFVRRGITATPYDDIWYSVHSFPYETQAEPLLQEEAPSSGRSIFEQQVGHQLCART